MIYSKFNIVFFSSFLFYLIPLSILTGPFLPDLLISLIGLIFLFKSLKDKDYFYYKNNFSYLYFLFCICAIFSSIISQYKIYSLESSLFFFRFGLFALATWYLIDNNKKFVNHFTLSLLATIALALMDGYSQYLFSHHIFGQPTFHDIRLSLTFDDKMYLGGYLSRLTPLLIGLLIFNLNVKNKKITYVVISLIFILTDILVYVSSERTALGLMIVITVFIIIFVNNFRLLRFITFFVSILSIIIISFLSPEIKKRNIDHTLNQVGITDNSRIVMFSDQHESHIITSYRIFIDNPLFGSGPNTFRKLCGEKKYNYNELSCSTHPHQVYIQALAEVGILGFLIFLLAPIYLIWLILNETFLRIKINKRRLSDYQICLIAAIGISFLPFLPTLNLFNNWINVIYFLPVGFFLQTLYKKK